MNAKMYDYSMSKKEKAKRRLQSTNKQIEVYEGFEFKGLCISIHQASEKFKVSRQNIRECISPNHFREVVKGLSFKAMPKFTKSKHYTVSKEQVELICRYNNLLKRYWANDLDMSYWNQND